MNFTLIPGRSKVETGIKIPTLSQVTGHKKLEDTFLERTTDDTVKQLVATHLLLLHLLQQRGRAKLPSPPTLHKAITSLPPSSLVPTRRAGAIKSKEVRLAVRDTASQSSGSRQEKSRSSSNPAEARPTITAALHASVSNWPSSSLFLSCDKQSCDQSCQVLAQSIRQVHSSAAPCN